MAFWKKKKPEDSNATITGNSVGGSDPAHESRPTDGGTSLPAPTATSLDAANSTSVHPGVSGGDTSDDPESKRQSWWRRALSKTNELLNTDVRDLWKAEGRLVDEEFLRELFATLVKTDMGNAMATRIRDSIHSQFRARRIHMQEAFDVIRDEIGSALKSRQAPIARSQSGPTVILVVGVNGSGKTTSIAKLAYRLTQQGNRVLLGAGDTFRAAAVEQLRIWSERIGCEIVHGDSGADPGSVVFKAIQKANSENVDICIIDTAGRLQAQSNLMQELEKIKRVIAKQIPDAPHEVLLVLDATAGQNAISQAKGFSQAAGCTGIVLAKLDGSAKGGVIVPIAEQFSLPVKFVGLGEGLEDLAEFDPDDYVKALLKI